MERPQGPPVDHIHIVETGLAVHGWLEAGADPDDVPPGVDIVVAGWSDGPFDMPRRTGRRLPGLPPPAAATRVYGAVFEMQVEGGLLGVSLTADDGGVASGYGTPGDTSLLDATTRPAGTARPLLQPAGGGAASGWQVDALLLRDDVVSATFGGDPVEITPHGVVLLISGDRTPPTLELFDAAGDLLASGTTIDLVRKVVDSGAWPA
ncbi:hypothetical protein QE364_001451 [Nocardioides zeae]|uniref:Uncharacterized protein n=1 Tax=Nocardioides zeae TaxID=1457234 RepID=A0ACC6IG65_9ACTN|nr:hypothetical protein [Nocardioides zeae]MDR6176740.1 hypothetical protein [Nocardioides zeae]MDR6209751.1 hypothetical protein [Nocardioides zeae]